MIRKALTGTVVYGLGAVLARSLVILQAPLFSFALDPARFGLLDILTLGINILNLCVALEVTWALAIYSCETKDTLERAVFASTALWFTIGCYVVLFFTASFFGPLARLLEHAVGQSDLARLFLITAGLQGIFLLLHGQLRWILRPGAFLGVALLYGIVNLGSSLLFVYRLDWGIEGILAGEALGALSGSVAAWLLQREQFRLLFDPRKLRQMLKFSAPLVPSSIAVLVALYVDRAVIGAVAGMGAVGLYGVAFRFAAVVGVLTVGVGSAVTPLIYHEHEQADTPRHIARLLNYYVLIGLGAVLTLGVCSDELTQRLSAPAYHRAHSVIPILAAALVAGSMYNFAPGLILKKRTLYIALINTLAAVLNLILNLSFVPAFGIHGAALATLLSAVAGFALWCLAGQPLYRIPYDLRSLLTAPAIVAILLWLIYRLDVSPILRPPFQISCWLVGLVAIARLLINASEWQHARHALGALVRRTPPPQ